MLFLVLLSQLIEMEGGLDADSPLDYANIQVFMTQNRYEAFVCGNNREEKLAVGPLEQLLPHIPGLKALQGEGSFANLKLELPENANCAAWFTKSTLNRFLDIVGSPDVVNITKVIEGEMSQLEEARKFHLSLYSQGHQGKFEDDGTAGHNSNEMAPLVEPEVPVASSDSSKSELLRAMDLRISALRGELAAAFSQAAAATLSNKEVADLAKFVQHFGAADLKNSLCKVLELSRKSQSDDLPSDDKPSFERVSRNDSGRNSNWTSQPAKLPHTETPVKYGVSPAKVAQLERQSSTESGESSDSSDEDQTSAERSRALIRSATPRRSASPMRRVQIGRAGSRRAPALTIKSLNFFPARERTVSQRDVAGDSSEEGSEQTSTKTENHVRRMSVQDAINLFERKQRDQTADSQLRNSLANTSLNGTKSVLRRWSAGMGESSAQSQHHIDSDDSIPVACKDEGDREFSNGLKEAKSEADLVPGDQSKVETAEVDVPLERLAEKTSKDQADTDITQRGEINERLTSSAEWTRQKEVELNQMLKKMMESQPTKSRRQSTSRNQKLSSEQRGGFYDHYKEKRDEKLRGENARQRAEKVAQFRAMQQILDERKAAMASTNGNDVSKKPTLKKSQKSAKNLPQSTNPKKETPKPSSAKKVSSKTSPLPATRKSWPSTPSPRAAGISSAKPPCGISPAKASGGVSPAKTPGGISSAGTTPTRRKPQSAPSHPRPTPKVEGSQKKVEGLQKQLGNVKETQTNNSRRLKGLNEKKQQMVEKSSKTTKAKIATASGDNSGMVPAKPSFYSKVTKKSSVVPLESKPFLRKGSGTGPGVGTVNKTKKSAPVESLRNYENMVEAQENEDVNASVIVMEHQEQDIVSPDHCDAPMESETTISSQQICNEVESFNEPAADNDDALKNMTEMPSQIQVEEESIISPSAWVEIEEDNHDLPNPHHDSTSQLANPANIVPIGLSSPRVRHSLSQMLQEDSSEPETTEWGIAENPRALVYQKDAPKGLKRLLKFARKSKTDANSSGWSSPSVFSEGESDAEESKASSKRNADNLLRKAALNAKIYGMQKTSVLEDYEKHMDAHLLSAQSDISRFDAHNSEKLQKNHVSAVAPTTKEEKHFHDSTSVYKINATHEYETPKILESKFSRIKQTRPCQILAMARLTIFATNSIQVGLHKHYDNGGSEKLSEKLCKIFRRLVAERMCICFDNVSWRQTDLTEGTAQVRRFVSYNYNCSITVAFMSTGEYRRSARISELDARRAQKAESRNEGNRAINSRMAQGQGTRKSSDHKLARKRKTRPVHDLVDNNVEIQVRKLEVGKCLRCQMSFLVLLWLHAVDMSSIIAMPERKMLDLLLDRLKRRDSYKIFAKPVDGTEVHDIYLMLKNAMHFNASDTVYYRQAHAMKELANKLFRTLKNDPENFEAACSMRGRRRNKAISGPLNSHSCNKTTGCRGERGLENFEVQPRQSYIPRTSFLTENELSVTQVYNSSKKFEPGKQNKIGFAKSLMQFASNLGPTAQMVAQRKLRSTIAETSKLQTATFNCHLQAPNTFISGVGSALENISSTPSLKFPGNSAGCQRSSEREVDNHSALNGGKAPIVDTIDIYDVLRGGIAQASTTMKALDEMRGKMVQAPKNTFTGAGSARKSITVAPSVKLLGNSASRELDIWNGNLGGQKTSVVDTINKFGPTSEAITLGISTNENLGKVQGKMVQTTTGGFDTLTAFKNPISLSGYEELDIPAAWIRDGNLNSFSFVKFMLDSIKSPDQTSKVVSSGSEVPDSVSAGYSCPSSSSMWLAMPGGSNSSQTIGFMPEVDSHNHGGVHQLRAVQDREGPSYRWGIEQGGQVDWLKLNIEEGSSSSQPFGSFQGLDSNSVGAVHQIQSAADKAGPSFRGSMLPSGQVPNWLKPIVLGSSSTQPFGSFEGLDSNYLGGVHQIQPTADQEGQGHGDSFLPGGQVPNWLKPTELGSCSTQSFGLFRGLGSDALDGVQQIQGTADQAGPSHSGSILPGGQVPNWLKPTLLESSSTQPFGSFEGLDSNYLGGMHQIQPTADKAVSSHGGRMLPGGQVPNWIRPTLLGSSSAQPFSSIQGLDLNYKMQPTADKAGPSHEGSTLPGGQVPDWLKPTVLGSNAAGTSLGSSINGGPFSHWFKPTELGSDAVGTHHGGSAINGGQYSNWFMPTELGPQPSTDDWLQQQCRSLTAAELSSQAQPWQQQQQLQHYWESTPGGGMIWPPNSNLYDNDKGATSGQGQLTIGAPTDNHQNQSLQDSGFPQLAYHP
ncbi:hypothetical protein KPL71_011351 [Citrus sinensis]|uniref:Uncharacterized protein n=1 Tax=Citrus sinensis TaxID=2711 RepID=A0ACB8L2Z4_CITSI|nr:hypothetical protein KPL71_011351 [Citrus sinensis]